LNVTVSLALLPFASVGVFLPAILKSCRSEPLFATANVTVPRGTVFFESANLSSLGLPAVTATVVADVDRALPSAATADVSDTAAASATSADPFQNVLTEPSSRRCGDPEPG
jgi:hypothetical protein